MWSKPGTGSTFTLALPALIEAYHDDERPEQAREPELRSNRSQREEELSR
ncbi:Two component sensor histidine kinase SenX3 [Mycobacterium tuberculosis]|nr:Two component sensor histidine kinase SenX3 [Mycobacterium tuberculosis]